MTPLELLDDHARKPRNIGKLLNATAVGDVGSIVAGDAMRFYIAVVDGRITAARFQVFNCADQVGAASVVTELAVGRSLDEARRLAALDVRAQLGGLAVEHLPPQIWALEGLRAAIAVVDGTVPACDAESEALVCRCHGVTEEAVRQAVTVGGARSVEDLVVATGAGSGCGSCKPDLVRILDEALRPADAPAASVPAKPSVTGRIQTLLRIQRAYATRLAPTLHDKGGDLELWDFDGRLVRVRLCGALLKDEAAARQALTDLEQLIKAQIDAALGVTVG